LFGRMQPGSDKPNASSMSFMDYTVSRFPIAHASKRGAFSRTESLGGQI
jgi:hypothetical protein